MVTPAGTTILAYDYEDRVSGITYPSAATNSFSYNGLDTRMSKVDSAGTSTYLRDGADVTDPVLEDGAANYTPGVSRRASSVTTFDNLNYIGSSTLQTDASQATTATRTYDAFGSLVATTGTPVGPFGFVGGEGYQEDGDSGLKLLGHRYYDSSTGRFLTRDTVKQGRNWYEYCSGNATMEVDPTGLGWRLIEAASHFLYVVLDEARNVLKWGVTHQPEKRYSNPALKKMGGTMEVVVQTTTRREALDQERMMVERYPGPLNKEPWAEVKSVVDAIDPTPMAFMQVGADFGQQVVDPYVKEAQARRQKALDWWLDE